MAKIDGVQEVDIDRLRPYERNAKIHGDDQVEKIANSIKEFGFLSPVLIDKEFNIIAGHGRVMAATKLGMKSVPCVSVEGLTDEQRKAYILADNRLAELAAWDFGMLEQELRDIGEIDMTAFGFEVDGDMDIDIDNLFEDADHKQKEPKRIQCPHCGEWFEA